MLRPCFILALCNTHGSGVGLRNNMTHRPWLNELFVKYLHFILFITKMIAMCDTTKPRNDLDF